MLNVTERVATTLLGISNWFLIIGAAFVLIGTVGSITMGTIRERFSSVRLAVNEAEARNAQLALKKFKEPRMLSVPQQTQVAQSLLSFANTPFDLSVPVSDPEAITIARVLANTLQMAKWRWVEWNHPTGPFMTVYSFDGLPNIGQGGGVATGIRVLIHNDKGASYTPAAKEIVAALSNAGIEATFSSTVPSDVPNHDTVHIVVGKKPQ